MNVDIHFNVTVSSVGDIWAQNIKKQFETSETRFCQAKISHQLGRNK